MQAPPSNTPFNESLPKLSKPQSFLYINTVTLLVCFMMLGFAYSAYLKENWIAVWVDLGIVVLHAILLCFRWRSRRKMNEVYNTLQTIHNTLNTPTMIEVGNSIILTMVFPSKELMNKMKSYHNGRF